MSNSLRNYPLKNFHQGKYRLDVTKALQKKPNFLLDHYF